MSAYLPLFSIEVQHPYFPDQLCRGLDFVVTPKTGAVIKKAGLLTRNTTNGISVFYDESKIESLQRYAADAVEPLRFEFKVFSRDPFFGNYTHSPTSSEDVIPYFENGGLEADASGKFRLHAEACVSETDFVALNSPVLADILSKRDRLIRPMFIITIGVLKKGSRFFDEQLRVASKRYYIKFNARETFWKYYSN